MKKKINPFILIPIAFTVIAVIAISSVLIYNYSLGYKVKEHTKKRRNHCYRIQWQNLSSNGSPCRRIL